MIGFFRTLTLAGWLAIAAAAIVAIGIVVYVAGSPGRRDVAAARAGAALATSRAASGAEATETIAQAADRDAAGDKLTQETAHAILSAPGADQRLDPSVERALRDGLCRRAVYRGRPECVQQPGAVEPSQTGPRR